jgi:hypothetical protein
MSPKSAISPSIVCSMSDDDAQATRIYPDGWFVLARFSADHAFRRQWVRIADPLLGSCGDHLILVILVTVRHAAFGGCDNRRLKRRTKNAQRHR